jgi:hypothetical protein
MDAEYNSLRREMLRWQDRRFDLLKLSIGVVTGLLGFKLIAEKFQATDGSGALWPLISSVLLLYLSAALLLTWYAARANIELATYIAVFYDDDQRAGDRTHYETRLEMLKGTKGFRHNVNGWIALVYCVLGVVSIVLPCAASQFAPPGARLYALVTCVILFLITAGLATFFSSPRDKFRRVWTEIKKIEAGTDT